MQSPYAIAIDAARDTLVRRARQYKWLVIGVALGSVLVLAAALVLASAKPLLALLLLPCPITALFALDLREVHRWRMLVLKFWSADSLQLDLLAKTLLQVPGLPLSTVQGMVDMLPAWPDARVPPAARAALMRTQDRVARIALHALMARSAAWALAVLAAMAAWTTHQPAWLAGWGVLAGGWVVWRRVPGLQMRRARAELIRSGGGTPASPAVGAAEWLPGVNCHGLPARARAEWQVR